MLCPTEHIPRCQPFRNGSCTAEVSGSTCTRTINPIVLHPRGHNIARWTTPIQPFLCTTETQLYLRSDTHLLSSLRHLVFPNQVSLQRNEQPQTTHHSLISPSAITLHKMSRPKLSVQIPTSHAAVPQPQPCLYASYEPTPPPPPTTARKAPSTFRWNASVPFTTALPRAPCEPVCTCKSILNNK